MTFTPDLPLATDLISVSQGNLRTNNNVIGDTFLLSQTAGGAQAMAVHRMSESGADPTTAANVAAIYTKDAGGSFGTELYWRRESNGSVIRMSSGTPTFNGGANRGVSFLPGGFLIQWGISTNTWNGTPTITLETAFSSATTYAVTANDTRAGALRSFVKIITRTTTTFTPLLIDDGGATSGSPATLLWIAVGQA